MREYIIQINWEDGKGSELRILARNKKDALDKAMDAVETVRDNVYSYYIIRWYKASELLKKVS